MSASKFGGSNMLTLALLALSLTVEAQTSTCGVGQVCKPSALQTTQYATSSLPTCDTAKKGQLRNDSTQNCTVRCSGTAWACVAGSTAGDGGYVYSGCAGAGTGSGALCTSGTVGDRHTLDAGLWLLSSVNVAAGQRLSVGAPTGYFAYESSTEVLGARITVPNATGTVTTSLGASVGTDLVVGNNGTLGRAGLAVAASGIYTDGGLVAYGGSGNDVTLETSGIRLENGTTDWQFQKVANGANSNLGIYGGSTNFVLWDRLSGTMTTAFDLAVGGQLRADNIGIPTGASGTARMLTTSGGLTQWVTALNAVAVQADPTTGVSTNTLVPVSGVMAVETMHLANSTNIGSITLSAGTGTAVVNTGAKCVCQDTSATPLVVRCSVSSTTLTATEASGTNVITYICL